jgi:hypothetical protein
MSEVLAASIITLMMDAASTCETSVNSYQTTWHNHPEDSHLHTSRHEPEISLNNSIIFNLYHKEQGI